MVKESFNGQISLYLEYYRTEERRLKVPLATLVTLCVVKQAEASPTPKTGFSIHLVPVEEIGNETREFYVNREIPGLGKFMVLHHEGLKEEKHSEIASCSLPALSVSEVQLCISGICSVLRYLIFHLSPHHELLGYQDNCLTAPAEVSTWTKFCEVDFPRALCELGGPSNVLPREFAQFEIHMNQPIKIHNIRKRMQQQKLEDESMANVITENGRETILDQETGQKVDPIHLFAKSQHLFAEGPDFLLSDAILFPHFYYMVQQYGEEPFQLVLPTTFEWFKRASKRSKAHCFHVIGDVEFIEGLALRWPTEKLPNQSLYKSDPKRLNPSARIFTRQPDIDRANASISENVSAQILQATPFEAQPDFMIEWGSIPHLVHPLGGELPPERLEKKCQQLENLAAAVLSVYKPSDVIVDFCSGGGHLAILLAYLLPEATVYLVENKEQSLQRAIQRVKGLGLKNCRFFQGNMDYFNGKFDIGVSLHACGVATDLVIQACIENRASFVSCPCCYGSVQANHMVSYPRSHAFSSISFKDYLVLGHTADQTHGTNDKEAQGRRAMNVVDTDRVLMASETGIYSSVVLRQLQPPSCSPKNNLIIATRAILQE